MCNFNKQSDDAKMIIHLFMTKVAASIGGANFLLSLIEAIKAKKPYALMLKESQVASNNSIVRWNKVIFKDKIELIESILSVHRSSQDPDFNLLNEPNAKKRKNILNLIRALSPVEFVVTPQNPNDGGGFDFKVFDVVSEDEVKLNPIFMAIFFCSTDFTKKALNYNMDS